MNAIYLRVSSEKQSSEMQLHAISLFLASKQIKEYVTYQDEGISGNDPNRPGLKNLLNDVKLGRIETLVIYKLDRLFRGLSHLIDTLELFSAHGTKLVSVTEGIDFTTPMGMLTAQILGAFGQFERSMIIERTRSGLESAKSKGIKLGRPSKYGPEFDEKIIQLSELGYNSGEISKALKVNRTTIYNIVREHRAKLSKSSTV